ncbi:MAG: phosphodiester glycosidase family protein, partial [Planctomycetota bacterium]
MDRMLVSLVGAFALCTATVAQPIVINEINQTVRRTEVRGFSAVIDLTHPSVEVVVTGPNAVEGVEATLEATDAWRTRVGVDLAINANFFGLLGGGNADIVGLSVSDGEVISPVRAFGGENDPALAFFADSAAAGRLGADDLTGVVHAIAGVGGSSTDSDPGTMLVQDGVNLGATARVQPGVRNPRTAAGVSADGERLIIVVIDGRQPGWSGGVALDWLGSYMISLGADDAINLDGGGSSSFLATVDGVDYENRPSDGAHRAVANHLGIRIDPTNQEGQDPGATRPIRGAWLRPLTGSTAIDLILDRLADAEVTDLYLETFYHGLASNQSNVFNDRFGSDVLAEYIERARLRGIRVHAWLEAAYWSFGGSGNYILNANPEWKIVDYEGNTDIGDINGQVFV